MKKSDGSVVTWGHPDDGGDFARHLFLVFQVWGAFLLREWFLVISHRSIFKLNDLGRVNC